MSKMRGLDKELENRMSGGQGFFTQKDIKDTVDIRIAPPVDELNGVPYKEVVVWWIDKKKYISPETFGQECPIAKEFDEARESGDESLIKLLDAKDGNMKRIERKTEWWLPILVLKLDDPNDVESSYEIVDDEWKIAQFGPMLLNQINKVVISRFTQPDPTDRVKGFCIMIQKTGSGMQTKYTAQNWPQPEEMPEDLYTEKSIPNIIKKLQEDMEGDDKLRSIARNYLYGEEVEDDEDGQEEAPESRKISRKPKKKAAETSEPEEVEEAQKTRARRKPLGKRDLVSDVDKAED